MNKENEGNIMHVSTIIGNIEKGIKGLYEPLGKALAPLGIYITPIVQDANYLNKVKYKGNMTHKDFLKRVENIEPIGQTVFIRYENSSTNTEVKVFVTEEVFIESIYSNEDFIKNVYNSELPIIFN